MEFKSSVVMAYVLYFCKHLTPKPIPVNSTKAQKLLYCCYGAVMAAFDQRLTDEHPKAWPFGPVFPRTFNDINKKRLTEDMALEFMRSCDPSWLKLIQQTLLAFGQYTATQLSNWSHTEGSPWSQADALAALDDRAIGLYFKPLLEKIRTWELPVNGFNGKESQEAN